MKDMTQEIDLGGTIYISSRRAAEITGYAQDYIGQLARSGQIDARRIAGLWYVREESLRNHKEKAEEYKPVPPDNNPSSNDMEASVSFDGKDYISAARASRITGYSQDYVGQLARSEKILSRQIGNRWYVDRAGIIEHKKHNDSLLAAVQSESVGLSKENIAAAPEIDAAATENNEPHFNYIAEEVPPMPIFEPKADVSEESTSTESTSVEENAPVPVAAEREINQIPIRVIPIPPKPHVPEPHALLQTSIQKYTSTPKMAMYLIVFVAVAISAFAGLMYLDFPRSRTITERADPSNDQKIAVTQAVPSDIASTISRLTVALLSKELEYKRE
jgi:hypothetical protein